MSDYMSEPLSVWIPSDCSVSFECSGNSIRFAGLLP